MKTQTGGKNYLAIKYESESGENIFLKTLRERVEDYFVKNNLSKYGNGITFFKTILVLTIFFGSYSLLISNKFSPAVDLLLATICGVSTVLIVMNIGHDAVHNALFSNKKSNQILSYVFELSGMSSYMWKINHNIIHHPYPNVSPVDSEINIALPFIRFSPHERKTIFHRWQHLYAPFLYLFFTLNLTLVRDFQDFRIFPKKSSQKFQMHFPVHRYIILFLSKIFYIGYALIIPMIVLNVVWWKVLLGFFFVHASMSIFELTIQLTLHANENASVIEIENNGVISNNWRNQVMENTTDYLPTSRIANFITGGINTHTIHHFFPGICHRHYVALTQILNDTAKEFGVRYRCVSLPEGLLSHFRLLKKLAIAP